MTCDFCGLKPGLGQSGSCFYLFETRIGLTQCESRSELLGRTESIFLEGGCRICLSLEEAHQSRVGEQRSIPN